jgi:hypothetical protein
LNLAVDRGLTAWRNTEGRPSKQAIAIGLSEARRAGGKVPAKKTG